MQYKPVILYKCAGHRRNRCHTKHSTRHWDTTGWARWPPVDFYLWATMYLIFLAPFVMWAVC